MQSNSKLLDAKQIAERLNISVRLAQRQMQEMEPIPVGAGGKHKLWRVRESALNAWIDRREKAQEEPKTGKPELTIIRPKKRRKPFGNYPQPVNGKIQARK